MMKIVKKNLKEENFRIFSSNVNEVIRVALNFFFFFCYEKMLRAPKAPKAPKAHRRN